MMIMEQVNPFVCEQFIEMIAQNKNTTNVDIESIPTGDEIALNPKIVKLKETFLIEKQQKIFDYKNSNILDVQMYMSEISLKLFIYISKTLEWNQDYIKLSGLKSNNFMKKANIKSRSTMYKGITELCRYGFLAKDIKQGYYWINPFRVFYGNRKVKYKDRIKIIN